MNDKSSSESQTFLFQLFRNPIRPNCVPFGSSPALARKYVIEHMVTHEAQLTFAGRAHVVVLRRGSAN